MTQAFLIKKPIITEKSTDLNASGKYVFMVAPSATKNEVKKAVKEIYRVDVTLVNIINLPGKPKRYRATRDTHGDMKKAIVTLKKGQTIDLGR